MLLLRIALVVGLLYFVHQVGFIIVVVLMSAMLALTMAPLVDWLRQSSLLRLLPPSYRRGTAATIVFLVLAAAFVGAGFMMVRPLITELTSLFDNWPAYQKVWLAKLEWIQVRYNALPPNIRGIIEQGSFTDLGGRLGPQLEHLLRQTLESGMLIVELILIPVLAFSFLTEGRPLKREFTALIPRARLKDGLYLMKQMGVILQSYAVGQLILALIAGGVVWVLMTALGIRYALAMAVVAAITRVIPVIGPVIGGIPIVLISTLQGADKGVAVFVAFCLMHFIESKVIMPKIIGYRIHLHPAVVIVVLLIGAQFFGMWGMFLAAPVAAIIKLLLYYFYVRPHQRNRWSGPNKPNRPRVATEVTEVGHRPDRPVSGVRSHSRAH